MPPRRLLLVKLSSLGDVVHALPLAEALRAGLGPDTKIVWAVRHAFAPLLEGNPNVSDVAVLEARGLGAAWRFGRGLARQGVDCALDTQGLLVSGIVTASSGAPRRIGFDHGREGNRLFLTEPTVPGRERRHIVEKLLGFCDALGIEKIAPRRQGYLVEGEAAAATALLGESAGPTIGCIVGASTPDKAWPAERWVELTRQLAERGFRPALLGAKGEAALAEQIVARTGGAAIDLVGKTPLRVLAATLARCAVVVGGDSGPTHLAVAVGAPVVGLYGVTDPARTGPAWGPAPTVVIDHAQADAPPEHRRPRHSALPDALARIPADAVAQVVESLLR